MKSEPVHYSVTYFELGLMQNMIYLIHDHASNQLAIIDPAWDIPAIIKHIQDTGAELTDVLITHCHDDHSNGITSLQRHFPALTLHYSQNETSIWPERPVGKAHDDGEIIRLGDTSIRILHTPGHSPGSACYLVDNKLFTGDTLFVYGCGRCDLPGGNPGLLFDSLQRLIREMPPETEIYPGHHYASEVTSTMAEQLHGNPFLHIQQRDAFILFRNTHSMKRQPPYQAVPIGDSAW